jgi:hypothetical protein
MQNHFERAFAPNPQPLKKVVSNSITKHLEDSRSTFTANIRKEKKALIKSQNTTLNTTVHNSMSPEKG